MKKKYKWIFLAVIAILSLGAYGTVLLKPVSVQAERAAYGSLQSHFTVSASVLPESSMILNSSASGNVSGIPFQAGAHVAEGEVLVATDTISQASLEIEREQYRRQLASARQEYDRLYGENGAAQSELKAAESEYKMAQKNYDSGLILSGQGGFISENELAGLKTQRDLAYEKYIQAREGSSEATKAYYQEQIDSCEKQLAALEETISPGAVRMPYDGVLWEVYTEEGAFLSPNQPVVKVYRPQKMKLEASVLSEDAASLSDGVMTNVTYADGTKGTAVLSFLSRTASQQMSAIGLEENRCSVELIPEDLPASVGAGQKADVSFTVVKAEDVLTVPASAIVPIGEESIVYKVINGKARQSAVTAGRRESGRVEVISGIEEGDIIVADPYNDSITEGSRVSALLQQR